MKHVVTSFESYLIKNIYIYNVNTQKENGISKYPFEIQYMLNRHIEDMSKAYVCTTGFAFKFYT